MSFWKKINSILKFIYNKKKPHNKYEALQFLNVVPPGLEPGTF